MLTLVSAKSLILPELKKVNQKYFFHNVLLNYKYTKVFKTLPSYQKTDYDSILYEFLEDNIEKMETALNDSEENKKIYQLYYSDIKNLISQYKMPDELYEINPKFRYYEDKLIAKESLNPVVRFSVIICKEYSSAKGYCVYKDRKVYSSSVLPIYISNIKRKREEEQSENFRRKRERSLMTDSLRYDIMKRDKFKCCICGATAKDGIKLHVDHILPVSKGGTTVTDNLRTLCDRCNLGKSDKYDFDDVN